MTRVRWFGLAQAGFFLLAWLAVILLYRSRAFNDPGALWHIKIGEQILQSGVFMRVDTYTYTFAGRTWIPQQWGAEILLALIHGLGGFDALLHLVAITLAGLFTWLFSRLIDNGMHPILAAVICAFAFFAGAYHYYSRPHMATLVLMAVTMALLVDYEAGRIRLRRLALLLPIFILWTNLHGGVLGGIGTLGLAIAGWIAAAILPTSLRARVWIVPEFTRRQALWLALLGGACLAAPWVNPFGWEMLATWKRIMGSTAMKSSVSEHLPLNIRDTTGQVTLLFAAFYLFALVGVLPRCPRVTWLLPLVWLALAIQSIRQGPIFAVVAIVAIADLWPHTFWYRLILKHGDTLACLPGQARTRPWLLTATILGVLGFALPAIGVRGWARLDPEQQPMELVEPLRQVLASEGPGCRIFNDANLGGFILYHAPGMKIYMDDRFELYGDEMIYDYRALTEDPEQCPRIEELAEKYGFKYAVVCIYEPRLTMEQYLSNSPNWEVIAKGEVGILFRRKATTK